MKITLLQWRSFLAVADSLSFTAAADRLRIRQPTLSSNIRNLETALGARLFDRDTKKVRLTPFGIECKRLAERLIGEAERIEIELRQHLSGERGALRIASIPNIFPTLLAAPLSEFRAQRPEVALQFADVTSDEAIYRVRQGQADLAIGLSLGEDADLRFRRLAEHRCVALLPARHRLAAKNTIAWMELLDERLILVQSRDSVASRVAQSLRDAGVAPRIDYRVNELTTAMGLLEGGFGVAIMAHHTAECVLKPGLVMRDLIDPRIVGQLFVITRADKDPSPALRVLIETLLRHAARQPRTA